MSSPAPDRDAFVEAVLTVVEQIPVGKVCTYGDVAEIVGRGGPRNVGQVMSLHGGAVPWWRVIRADGRPVAGLESTALDRLRGEGVVFCGAAGDRVDLRISRWNGTGLATSD